MNKKLRPVKSRSLSEDVFESLRDAIFSGRFKPGDALRELHLARELAVSQMTARDALVKLESYGLVVRVPNRETVVTRHSQQEVRERVALRTVLEELACLEAARRMTPEDFETLDRKLRKLTAAATDNDYFETSQADLEFHRAIWRMSGNNVLYETLDRLTTPLMAFISVLRSARAEQMLDVMSPHDEVIRALRSRKPALIRSVSREHSSASYNEFLNSGLDSLEELLTKRAS